MKRYGKEVRELLRGLIRDLGLLQKEKYACCNLTLAQCHCLTEAGKLKKATLNELSGVLKLDQSTVSRMVEGLVKEGFMNRSPGEDDRRRVEIKLTSQGEKSHARIESVMEDYYEGVMEKIPSEKRDQVIESLQLLIEAIQSNETSCCGGSISEKSPHPKTI